MKVDLKTSSEIGPFRGWDDWSLGSLGPVEDMVARQRKRFQLLKDHLRKRAVVVGLVRDEG